LIHVTAGRRATPENPTKAFLNGRSMRASALLAASLALLALAAGQASHAADPRRGRALYELHCGFCHSESVHGRAKRVAADFEAIRGWVTRWSRHLKLEWSAEDIANVTVYLNETYYHHPCPPSVCKVVSDARPVSGATHVAASR